MKIDAQWKTTLTPSEYSKTKVEIGNMPNVPNAWINTYTDNCNNLPPISEEPPFLPANPTTNHIMMRQLGNMDISQSEIGIGNNMPTVNCQLTTDYLFKTDLIDSKLYLDGVDYNGTLNRYLSFWRQNIEVHQPVKFLYPITTQDINCLESFTANTANISTLTVNDLFVNNKPTFNNGIKIKNSALEITDASNNIVWNFRPDGKLGIGVSNAEMIGPYWLWVKNGIMTERLKVAVKNTLDWKDYVFDKSYKLRTLEEVEAYILANKHLPEIPSAEEVVKEGIDVQTMDAKLLQKIEELTLYVIDLKKEINQLKLKK